MWWAIIIGGAFLFGCCVWLYRLLLLLSRACLSEQDVRIELSKRVDALEAASPPLLGEASVRAVMDRIDALDGEEATDADPV